jgi:ABC-type arginine transport system permease subunit
VDSQAVAVGISAVAAALLSGFAGAYLGAWKTTRHDRVERARTRRIEAADDLVQAWATALFGIDAAITALLTGFDGFPALAVEAQRHVNVAIKSSVRVDLLFGVIGLAASNSNAVRDGTRGALHAVQRGDADTARQHHAAASLSLAYLVNLLADEIESTGTRRDLARKFKTIHHEPEANPANRATSSIPEP